MTSIRPLMAAALTLLCGFPARAADVAVDLAGAVAHRAFGGLQPRLSPDGKQIALSFQGGIAVMPSDGGVLTILTRAEGWDVDPAWSADGARIACVNAPNFTTGELRLMQSGDGGAIPLPKTVRARGPLYFYPNGKRLLGQFSATGDPERLAWCQLDTAEVVPVGITAKFPRGGPYALSPDGKWIVFAVHQDLKGEQEGMNSPQAELWKSSADGGDTEKLFRWRARIYGLCWDAASRGLYFVSDAGVSHYDVWYLSLTNAIAQPRRLSSGQADEDWPSVSADGAVLIHTDNREEATALVRYDTRTGESRTLSVEHVDYREPTATLRLSVWDAEASLPTIARVSVQRKGGKFHAPLGALYRITGGLGHFYCREQATLQLPLGEYELAAVRGPEYRERRARFELRQAGETKSLSIELERWTNAAANGWFSGENHVHANYGYSAWYNTPRSTLDLCEGEDLNVANIMVANSDGDGVYDREFFRGAPDSASRPRHLIYWNEEFRSTIWGHMTLVNLSQLVEPIFTGFKGTTNPWDVPSNADIAERAHWQHASVSYTHPASNPDSPYDGAYSGKGLPVDAALGRIDTLDVIGPGYEAGLGVWYRLLNCGFRIPAAAGTDCFLSRVVSYPPGWGRCYVKLTNGLTYRDWIEGQRQGRSFISKGIMLDFAVEGREMGQSIALQTPGPLHVTARAACAYALEKFELVQSGKVVAMGRLSDDRSMARLDQTVQCDGSGWLAVRASGGASASHQTRFDNGRGLVAHSNPIFVEVKDRPLDAKTDAAYFLTWIDRLEGDLRKRDRIPSGWEAVQRQLDGAREVYRKLAGRAAP